MTSEAFKIRIEGHKASQHIIFTLNIEYSLLIIGDLDLKNFQIFEASRQDLKKISIKP